MRIKSIILFLLCAAAIGAQPRLRTPEFYLGVHGGVSASSIIFTPSVANMTPITRACVLSGNGGIVFRYAGHKYCAFQTELNYLHRGWSEYNSTIGTYSRHLHYIELPILMHLNIGSKSWRWIFNLGPQIGYCVKDEGNSGTLVNGEGQTQYNPIDHPFDWGLLAGTGVSWYTRKTGTFELEARFDFSFGGVFGTGLMNHFSMANPIDLSINLGWLMPVRSKR